MNLLGSIGTHALLDDTSGTSAQSTADSARRTNSSCESPGKASAPMAPALRLLQRYMGFHDRLQKLVQSRFPGNLLLAEEAMMHVQSCLEDDGYARLRKGKSDDRFEAFLHRTSTNLIEDFRRSRRGRPRVPKWVTEGHPAGRAALRTALYELAVVDDMASEEVIGAIAVKCPEISTVACRQELSAIRDQAFRRARPRRSGVPPSSAFRDLDALDAAPELHDDETERDYYSARRLFDALLTWLEQDTDPPGPPPEMAEILALLNEHLDLAPEDRLILKLQAVEGLTLAQIKRLICFRGDLYKRAEAIHSRVRVACKKAGLLPDAG